MSDKFDKRAYRRDDAAFVCDAHNRVSEQFKLDYHLVQAIFDIHAGMGAWCPGIGPDKHDKHYFRALRDISVAGVYSPRAREISIRTLAWIQRALSTEIFLSYRAVFTSKAKVSMKLEYAGREGNKLFFQHDGCVYRTVMSAEKLVKLFGEEFPCPGTKVRFLGKVKSSLDTNVYPRHPHFGYLFGRFFLLV